MKNNQGMFSRFLAELENLGNLEVAARSIVEGTMLGIHQSPYHGFSAEFSQYRPYNTGDNIKHLDWKLFARSEKYYIREYMEETNLRAHIFLDISKSMSYKEKGLLSKLEYGKYLAAALTYLLIHQNDAVGLAAGGKKLESWLRPSSHRRQLHEILKILDKLAPENSTDLPALLKQFSERLPRAGMSIIISDLITDTDRLFDSLKGIKHIGQDVLLLQILDPMEIDFEYENEAEFIDLESGENLKLSPQLIRSSYLEQMDVFLKKIHNHALDLGISHQLFSTLDNFHKPLAAFLMRRHYRF
jgi:uncharacterized protein (DUF58 family)